MARSQRVPRDVHRVLAALAHGALGEGYVAEVPARMMSTIRSLSSSQERDQFLKALRIMDTKMGARLLTGKPVPVSWLRPDEAEALLKKWKVSRVPMQRQLSQAIIPLALSSAYGYPGKEWERIGYQGPIGPPPDEPKRLSPIEVTSDDEMNCDVVIVGSGAGGGCVAAGLAAAGFDVIVIEKGSYRNEADFTHLEPEATRDLYLYGMTLNTSDNGCRIIAGSTLGGGTVVNYTTSFHTPDYVL
ncbi:MAG TPA: FAD-binding protein, partial [Actinomycetota bacterium]|nr:FAD-binding protein [Actinomycetota bacterium]